MRNGNSSQILIKVTIGTLQYAPQQKSVEDIA